MIKNLSNLNEIILKCPVCHLKIFENLSYFTCENNHSYDISKKGYLNLLLANDKNSKSPGDSKLMVQAREDFLKKEYYQGIAQKTTEVISQLITNQNINNIVDVGCGTGYYLKYIYNHLQNLNMNFYGIDISKEAIHKASNKHDKIKWLIGTSKKLPFLDQSVDILISIFSPIYMDEMMRVLNNSGFLIALVPGDNHLIHLRKNLFDEIQDMNSENYIKKFNEFMNIYKELDINYSININSQEDIQALIQMTPYGWKSPQQNLESIKKFTQLEEIVDIKCLVFVKKL